MKAAGPDKLLQPIWLPVRDTPELLAAFGPVPRRRIANARKKTFRFHSEQVYPPLEILGNAGGATQTVLPFQMIGLQQEVSQLAGVGDNGGDNAVQALPSRFLRRRYRSLLRRLPQVIAQTTAKGELAFHPKIPEGAIGEDVVKAVPLASAASQQWWAANPIVETTKRKGK